MAVDLDFRDLGNVSPSLASGMKAALIWYAEEKSPSHLVNMFHRMRHFLISVSDNKDQPMSSITSVDLLNYRSSLNPGNSWYLAALKGFLKKWHSLGIPGVSKDAVILLRQLRLAGNKKGVAVLTMDPDQGPLTDIELQSIRSALNGRYALGQLHERHYLLAWLVILLGQRPVQYAALKVCDLSVEQNSEGQPTYVLKVPRAKQRDQLERAEFKNHSINPDVGELLLKHAKEVRRRFSKLLIDANQAPLFAQEEAGERAQGGFEFHATSNEISWRIKSIFSRLKAYSERTGSRINCNATRFRRTVGTRAAEEGYGELVIAELLDHTDTQNARVYVQATPKILENIDRAVAFQMAPLAQAFAGKIVRDESAAVRGADPTSRIVDPKFCAAPDKAVGTCGSHGFCGFLAPIACYTCLSFQPWLDGPHLAVYEWLEKERERLKTSADARIAATHDRTRLAVAQVILQCAEIRGKEGGGHG